MTSYIEHGRQLRAEYIRDLAKRHRQRRAAQGGKPGRAMVVAAAVAVLGLAGFTSLRGKAPQYSSTISPSALTVQSGAVPMSGSFDAH
jgi:hypothetical protein